MASSPLSSSKTTILILPIAVVHVASSLLVDDLARLVDHVKDLVGETDFSFDVSTDLDSKGGSAVPGISKGKAD